MSKIFFDARAAAGLSQAEVGHRANVTQECISLLERGRRVPTVPTFVRVCRALGLDPAQVISFYETT